MGSTARILGALVWVCTIWSAHAQLFTVQRAAGRVAAAHVTGKAQASQVPLQLQDHPWMKLLKSAKRGDPPPSPGEAEVRQQLQLDFARLLGEHQRAALGAQATVDERAAGTAEPAAAPAQQPQVPAQQPDQAPSQPQQPPQPPVPVPVTVGSRPSSAAAAADRAALLEMQKRLAVQLGRIEETLRRMEAADKEARAQARERALARAQARARATTKALPQPQVPVVPVQQRQALPATTPQRAAHAVQEEAGKRAQQPLYERSLLAQQQQQQQDPASDLPPRTCRVTDSPIPGSNAMRSYGLAMVQADKLPPLPSAPGSGGYAPTAGPGVSRTAARAGVLVCLVSSGVDASSPTLVNSPIAGCRDEDPLDPGGCPFPWDRDATGQGTHLASLVAGSAPGTTGGGQQGGALGVVPGVKIYSVRVWDRSPSWRGYAGDGAFGSNRMIAYNSCEGHLRGESAQNLRRTNFRMVMLLDVQATSAAPSVSSNGVVLYPSEQEWIDSAARYGDDILWVAPAGDTPAPAYPAALSAPNNRLLSVGAVGCDGKPWPAAGPSGRRVDLLAPGVDIVGAAPARGGGATLTVAPLSGGGDGGAKGEPFALAVALQGDAAGRGDAEVTLQPCDGGKCSPGDARQACVVPTFRADAGGAVCDALSRGACSGGIVLVPQGIEPLMGDDVASAVSRCAPWYGDSRQQSVPPRPRPPVLLAPPQAGGRLASMVAARGSSARAWLGVAAAQQAKRTGTSQAAAWVAGAASRLMARYPQCGAADVASVLIESALLLGPDGKPTGARGRGGLLQVKDAEGWLSGRACAAAKEPAASSGGG